ncbi:MAG TPA: glycosyl hydrolase [Candidatus Limnocylindrales bacterium]
MNLDWGNETVAAITADLGAPPATLVSFVSFPLTQGDLGNLDAAAAQARDAGALLIVTLEPHGGLSTVTGAASTDLATTLARYGADGVPTIVRFAHEMNGTWYPWGQNPAAYIAAFRIVADAIHAGARTSAMLWAPNQGEGYPFTGGQYHPAPGTAAFRAVDTNHDGKLDPGDDPYAPYWPGADSVDWVGMSLYHWGTAHPWGRNSVPATGKFADLVSGSTPTSVVPIPNFYAGYAERYGKPMAIVETAAFFRPGGNGDTESAIKTAWLGQVFSPEIRSRFPLLRIVNWFEWRKHEVEVHAVVDWRITANATLRGKFVAAMTNGFRLGPAVRAQDC